MTPLECLRNALAEPVVCRECDQHDHDCSKLTPKLPHPSQPPLVVMVASTFVQSAIVNSLSPVGTPTGNTFTSEVSCIIESEPRICRAPVPTFFVVVETDIPAPE